MDSDLEERHVVKRSRPVPVICAGDAQMNLGWAPRQLLGVQ
jgi:hypothetical protein